MHGCQGDSREHENILFVVYKDADFLGDVKFSYEGSPQFMANQKPNWAVFEFGEKMPIAKCMENKDKLKIEALKCLPLLASASFDEDLGRFEITYEGAYIQQSLVEKLKREKPHDFADWISSGNTDSTIHPDDLFFEVGKCNAF